MSQRIATRSLRLVPKRQRAWISLHFPAWHTSRNTDHCPLPACLCASLHNGLQAIPPRQVKRPQCRAGRRIFRELDFDQNPPNPANLFLDGLGPMQEVPRDSFGLLEPSAFRGGLWRKGRFEAEPIRGSDQKPTLQRLAKPILVRSSTSDDESAERAACRTIELKSRHPFSDTPQFDTPSKLEWAGPRVDTRYAGDSSAPKSHKRQEAPAPLRD